MELSAMISTLELAGGPAFIVEEGLIRWASPEAEALGLRPETALSAAIPEIRLPDSGSASSEHVPGPDRRSWSLRSVALEGRTLCVLRPEQAPVPGPNESSLFHAAGRIRTALQELTTALDGLSDRLPETPEAQHQAARGLRSVYQLRRTAEELELFARLRAGSYALNRQCWAVASRTAVLCGELGELLELAGIELNCSLPRGELRAYLDWPLTAALLRELVANAAAHCADGKLSLKLSRNRKGKLLFTLRNRSDEPLPEPLFRRHRSEQSLPLEGMGLGLDLVSAGAALHGGGLLLSQEEAGTVTALLSLTPAAQPDEGVCTLIQLPEGPQAALSALSGLLPPEAYRLEGLL